MKETAIAIENITKKFEDVTAVDGLSLVVNKGELRYTFINYFDH